MFYFVLSAFECGKLLILILKTGLYFAVFISIN